MKRIFALAMTLVVALTLAMPLQAFAASMDQDLENAIKIAKTKFDIPAEYKFNSSLSTDGTKKVFYLSWDNNDSANMKNINVRIDENGMILGYDSYSQDDYVINRKLPAISRKEAKVKADEFIKNIDPALLPQLKYQESNQTNLLDSNYYLSYYRVVNGIPFYNDQVSLTINRETGRMLNYYRQWTDVSSFPAAVNIKTLAQAQEAYKSNLGLKLIYRYSYNDEKIKTYAVYTPVYDNNSFAVNAFTGERTQTGYGYYGPFYDRGMGGMMNQSMKAAEAAAVVLNPDELKAVEEAGKLKTLEEAEKIARDTAYLGLTADYKLTYSNLNQSYPIRSEYVWNLNFNKEDKDNPGNSSYISATINANSGQVTSFYRSTPYVQNAKAKYDQTASKAAVEAFLKQYYPDYYNQVKYDELSNSNIIFTDGAQLPQNYSFSYNRIKNGIEFPDNGAYINYDAVNGMITSFNLNWFNIEFPAVDKAIAAGDAYTRLFSDIGLSLEYKVKKPVESADAKILPQPAQTKVDVELVYALDRTKPLFIDAFTGSVLNYDGEPYKEVKPVAYTDLKGNYAEEKIMVLAENGVYLEGTEFKPNANITQKDFMTLLSKTLSYYGPVITPKSASKDIDSLYAYLIREGIIKQGEKAPDAAVTREDAVKFIIRAMKLDKAADLKDIYVLGFKDKDSINDSLRGYIALAAGFKIVVGTGGKFNPKTDLTRAEAAVMIYNYLQV